MVKRLRLPGFGMVMLLVVLAVVLLLAARHARSLAPSLKQVAARPTIETHGEVEAGEALGRGELPDLKQMQGETDAHADDVKDALAAIE